MKRAFLIAAAVTSLLFATNLHARLGENLPQLIKRFGHSYTEDYVSGGTCCHFRLNNFSVDCVLSGGVSTCETYYSYAPLKGGEPPQEIVQGILKTNVPRAKWKETPAGAFQTDYAMRSDDNQYIATLNYRGAQPERATWTMTVQKVRLGTQGEMVSARAPATFAPAASLPAPAPATPAATVFTPAPPATPSRLDPAERARLVADFREAASQVLTQAKNDGFLVEPTTLAEVKDISPPVAEAIARLSGKAAELRGKLDSDDRLDDIRPTFEVTSALSVLQKAIQDLKAANTPAASVDLGVPHGGSDVSQTDEQKPVWKCIKALQLLCSRLQSQAKPHLARARAAADAGQNGSAIAEYQEAYKTYPDPDVAKTIKRLREDSLGL